MSETRSDPPRWGVDPTNQRQARPQPGFYRFLGGSPGVVFLRLLFVSAIVGAVLMWLRIRPIDIILNVEDLIQRLWNLGFDSIREIGDYILAGAVIVVPIWLIARLLNVRNFR